VAGGIPFDVNKAIVLGDNLVDLGPTAQLASISAKIDLTAKEATLLQTEADIITAIGSGGGSGGGGGATLAEIEASTVLAKEATVASRASQASVSAIPTNPLLTTDTRLNNLDAAVSTRSTLTATAVRTELATELGQVSEVHAIHGLDAANPMTVTKTSRTAGTISQTISGDGTNTSTVTRT
jgi:hypothetical protein